MRLTPVIALCALLTACAGRACPNPISMPVCVHQQVQIDRWEGDACMTEYWRSAMDLQGRLVR